MSTTLTSPSVTTSPWEKKEEDSTPDLALRDDIYFYTVGLVCGAVCLVGIAANCLTLMVWSGGQTRRYPCVPYFIALAVYDTLFLLSFLSTISVLEILFKFVDEVPAVVFGFHESATVFFPFFMNVVTFGSVYTTACLATDRCLAVVRPLTWPQTCGVKRTVVVLVLVLAWSVLVNIPIAMEGTLSWEYDQVLNESFLQFVETDYSHGYFHTNVYLLYIFPAVSFVIPIVFILITNVILVYTVRSRGNSLVEAGQTPTPPSPRQARGQRETRMVTWQVVVISLLTLLSRSLITAQYVWMATAGTIFVDECSLGCLIVSALGKLMLVLNASLNFFFYLYFTRTFRQLFHRRFPCGLRRVPCCGRCEKRRTRRETSVSALSASLTSLSSLPSEVVSSVHLTTYHRH
ncbi:hypothetical protein ACOMHN_046653 [Nucella lapillus]